MTHDEQIAALIRLVANLSSRLTALEKRESKRMAADNASVPAHLTADQRRLRHIVETVAISARFPLSLIVGPALVKPVSQARNDAYLACRRAGFSTPQIGAFFGRHHTSVISGSREAERRERAKWVHRDDSKFFQSVAGM